MIPQYYYHMCCGGKTSRYVYLFLKDTRWHPGRTPAGKRKGAYLGELPGVAARATFATVSLLGCKSTAVDLMVVVVMWRVEAKSAGIHFLRPRTCE